MLKEIEKYAKEKNIPIIEKEGMEFLKNIVKENNVKNILEIGTAIGYSAINMSLIDKDIKIITIERDYIRYQEAINNIKLFKLENRIKVINQDALDINLTNQFDLIFIDAAKAQSIKFFNKFENNLKQKGIIITDNLSFHGLVEKQENLSRNLKQLVRKINNYIEFLKENNNYITTFYSVGDGMSVSIKKK